MRGGVATQVRGVAIYERGCGYTSEGCDCI